MYIELQGSICSYKDFDICTGVSASTGRFRLFYSNYHADWLSKAALMNDEVDLETHICSITRHQELA